LAFIKKLIKQNVSWQPHRPTASTAAGVLGTELVSLQEKPVKLSGL